MATKSTPVADYVASQPGEWQPTLRKLRAACRRELTGYREEMRYGMPSYVNDGTVEVSFKKQARYLSLYILKEPVFDANRAKLVGLSLGKGCIRFRSPDQIEWDTVVSLLADTRASDAPIC
jgi:uncharacterized protein YdhG (YjbR/CyaY superfamily)